MKNYVLWLLWGILLLAGCMADGGEEWSGTTTPAATVTEMPTNTPLPTPTAVPAVSTAPTNTPIPTNTPVPTPDVLDVTLCFAGDFSLADDVGTTKNWIRRGQDISQCIDPKLIEIMKAADLMCLNNEFVYSTRGEAVEGKLYTYRGDPERASVLLELGVDLANLANNHARDYGEISLLDTLDTLDKVGVDYVGAGRNFEEASKPYYFEVDGIKIAIVSASRAGKLVETPQATETSAGVMRCNTKKPFINEIKEADANADVVIAYVHWGTEYSTVLQDIQITSGKLYLDAGADVIIGAHTHCIQGIEFYDDKPIFYSLGNFWFNSKELDTLLLKLHITGDRENPEIQAEVVPALQKKYYTSMVTEPEELTAWYEYMESISVNAEIDENGIVREKK